LTFAQYTLALDFTLQDRWVIFKAVIIFQKQTTLLYLLFLFYSIVSF